MNGGQRSPAPTTSVKPGLRVSPQHGGNRGRGIALPAGKALTARPARIPPIHRSTPWRMGVRSGLVMRRSLAIFLALAAFGSPLLPPFRGAEAEESRAHPKVILDRLDLSAAPAALPEESYLRDTLAREARRADWGAGRGSQIEYRFRLDSLEVTEKAGVVSVSCTASGWLPKSRHAKSHLTFGGAPRERKELVRHVLQIVAGGVVTRLAEMERRRRNAP